MMYIHQHWTLFDHLLYWKGHLISAWTKRLLSLTSCCCHAPRFSPKSLMFFASFCISWFLNLHSKSLKRGAIVPPPVRGPSMHLLPCIFVQCCAFERCVLCTVSPLPLFSLVPTFVKEKLHHGEQNIINIMPNVFWARTNLSNLYKMFHLTDTLCQLLLDEPPNFCRWWKS